MPSPTDVYLHIGLSKTGTSYLQEALWANRQQLHAAGVLIPGNGPLFRSLAVWDLMGRRPRGADLPQVPGSWQALVDAVHGWHGTRAVVSEEGLALARPRQVRRAVESFSPSLVHVVVTLRDLMHVIPATWQQELAKGATWALEEYLAAVRDPESGPVGAGVAFWLRQDVTRVLDGWETLVPRDRIHIVTVPPPGTPRGLLLKRFAEVARFDSSGFAMAGNPSNASVGVVEAEVLRRLNVALEDRLNERQYTRVVARGVREALQERRDTARIAFPAEHVDWVSERARSTVDELRRRNYDVSGDLDDLLGTADNAGARQRVDPGELADAALAALQASVEQHAQFWQRARTREPATAVDEASRFGSFARATGYRARVAALELADRNRLVRRALTRYLGSGRSG